MVRKLTLSDTEAVFKISSQIWEGDDYVKNVFDKWVLDEKNVFVGYFENRKLIGFGRMRYLTKTDIWLEALRKDQNTKIKGVGYKIAEYYLNYLKNTKIDSIRFSTYFGNVASIKLNEKLGFKKILTLSLKSQNISELQVKSPSEKITQKTDFNSLKRYCENSSYLKGTKNFMGKGWIVYQYSDQLLVNFFNNKKFAVYIEDNEIKGAVLFTNVDYKNIFWISFIDSSNKKIFIELVSYLALRAEGSSKIQMLIPSNKNLHSYINELGFTSWEQNNDFLLYEYPKSMIEKVVK